MASLPREFSKLAVASGIATLVDGIGFFILELLFTPGSVALGFIAVVCAVLGGLTHFLLCRFWVFDIRSHWQTQAGKYVAASGAGALIHGTLVGGMSMFIAGGIAWTVSKIVVYIAWTYPTSKWFVFTPEAR